MRVTSLVGATAGSRVDIIFDELSLHGQFRDLSVFGESIGRVMRLRHEARRYGVEVRCHRNTVNAEVAPGRTVVAAVRRMSREDRSALLQRLTRVGPFWTDARRHGSGEYLECRGEVVTDHGVGEAAYCVLQGVAGAVVTVDPSDWLQSPLRVEWHAEGEGVRQVEVDNLWTAEALRAAIEGAPRSVESWADLEDAAAKVCPDLTFSPDAFEPLRSCPFHPGVAQRLLARFRTLQEIKRGFDARGRRTEEAKRLYQREFVGSRALFSDSTEGERRRFPSEMTFRDPTRPGEKLFCPWHGKARTLQFRVHFSWPIRAREALRVVYVGPKITKR